MIRLTEVVQTDLLAKVKAEGELTEGTLQVLVQALEEYRRQGLSEVWLLADGLVAIDQRALEQAWPRLPDGLSVVFHTSRFFLQQILQACGVKVVFVDSK